MGGLRSPPEADGGTGGSADGDDIFPIGFSDDEDGVTVSDLTNMTPGDPAVVHVVATHTHFFIAYAFYHPQDWSAFWGSPARSSPAKADQHLHDMEGCLVVVPRADDTDLTGRGIVAIRRMRSSNSTNCGDLPTIRCLAALAARSCAF